MVGTTVMQRAANMLVYSLLVSIETVYKQTKTLYHDRRHRVLLGTLKRSKEVMNDK